MIQDRWLPIFIKSKYWKRKSFVKMKLIAKNVDKGMQGWAIFCFITFGSMMLSAKLTYKCFLFVFRSVVLIPEEPEDMWHAYNLISEDDYVRSTTIRKVQNETATGSSSSSRVRTTLTICVESIDFDTQACVLRLKGRNCEENQYVKVNWALIQNKNKPKVPNNFNCYSMLDF